jgi:photosystem II stability/assembly factor-like uncharacterized protein
MRLFRITALLLVLCLPSAATATATKSKKGEKPPEVSSSKLNADTFKGLALRNIGPALMSGRIADLAIHPLHQSTWYAAVGSGGVWKTTNAGTSWTPIFDQEGSFSIGCVTVDPNHPEVVWVGTGENVGGRHVGFGDGIYKSLDGGKNWQRMGLEKSEHIGMIAVDPRNSDVVLVAAQGPLWSAGGDRGIYKTTDGGKTWDRLLGDDQYTGGNEILMDPRNPDVLYASTHQRIRTVAALVNGGPGSAIHKSLDGGTTWRRLHEGLPEEEMGKIGLAISPQKPDVIYATIELAHRKGGFFRSTDGGETWEKRSDYVSGGTGPHYYQEIFASPHRFDHIYQMDASMRVTEDGGKTWRPMDEEFKHGDSHALAFDPRDPDYLLTGSDGGIYESWDLGKAWKFVTNLPLTQFYKVALDNDTPFYNIYGGTQDNNTQGGPSRTVNVNGIRSSDWFITLFADGHQPAVDPTNPDIIYSEWQQGNLVRYDKKTGEIVYIKPLASQDEAGDRFNWDAPILISPHNPARLYYASQRLWRSDDRGDSWRAVSDDLTRDQDRFLMPMMGRVQSFDAVWDLFAMSNFATITSLAESPLEEGLLYVGTDDNLLQISADGGETWRKFDGDDLPGVPAGSFINDIKADLHDSDTVYIALDNHKQGDFRPFLLKSIDRGTSFTSIAGDLPDRHLVWRLVQDHENPQLLFVGTEFGIFFTVNGGKNWVELAGDVPQISFRDLAIQRRESDLVAASFGRGFFILDDYSPLRQVSEDQLAKEATLFPVRKAWWYIERRPLGRGNKATQGADFFTAPNPPFGAVFTYYLREDSKTSAETRKDREAKLAKEGKDTPYPGWGSLDAEHREEEHSIVLTVRDSLGQVVRHLEGPAKEGFHRLEWDLRYPSTAPFDPDGEEDSPFGPQGWLAAPGTYSVSMARRVNGEYQDLSGPQTFDVVPLGNSTLKGMPPAEASAFFRRLGEIQRAATGASAAVKDTARRLTAIGETLRHANVPDHSLAKDARALEDRLLALQKRLDGDLERESLNLMEPPSISSRLGAVQIGNSLSTYGPTKHHLNNFDIASKQLDELRRDLNQLIEVDLPTLEEKMEAAGLPWTPGRGVPGGR